ncbi:serine/threonine-protein kinase [Bifidobacterium choloepi]
MSEIHALNLEPGDVVGGYTLVSRLGAGAMGSVWRVVDDGGQAHAMKILRDSLSDDAADDPDSPEHRSRVTARERLRREAMALKKISNPGVCAIDDMELDDSVAFIVTELIEGENLREDVAHNGKYVAEDLERLASKLIAAVQAVHDAGIVHRDIKPTNVMVSLSGPILVDFGIAMGAGESHVTTTGLVMGTPGFIAPEIIDGAESDDETDWWSVASVLAFAATGQPVFGKSPMMAVLEREASGNANLAGLPPRTMAAFRSALNPDRSKRCSPQELLNAITQDAWDSTAWQDAGGSSLLGAPAASSSSNDLSFLDDSAAAAPSATSPSSATSSPSSTSGAAMPPFGSPDPRRGSTAAIANPRLAWRRPLPPPPPRHTAANPTRPMLTALPTTRLDEAAEPTVAEPHAAEPPTTRMPEPYAAEPPTIAEPVGDYYQSPALGRLVTNTEAARNGGAAPPAIAPTAVAGQDEVGATAVQSPTAVQPQPVATQPEWNEVPMQPTGAGESYNPYGQQPYGAESYPQNPYTQPPVDSRADYPRRGALPCWLLAIPIFLLGAAMPFAGLTLSFVLLWILMAAGLNVNAQRQREMRRGGQSRGSDAALRVVSFPAHLLKGLGRAIPAMLLDTLIAVCVAVIGTVLGQLPLESVGLDVAGLAVAVKLPYDSTASLTAGILGLACGCGWLVACHGPGGEIVRTGAGSLRGKSGSTRSSTRLYVAVMLGIWLALTAFILLAALATPTVDWTPFLA